MASETSGVRNLNGAVDRSREVHRVAVASAIGTTIEWYDFFIYGTAAAVVFAPQFFPQVSALAGTLASFATFPSGLLRVHLVELSWGTSAIVSGGNRHSFGALY